MEQFVILLRLKNLNLKWKDFIIFDDGIEFMSISNQGSITWQDDKVGYRKEKFFSGICYKPMYAIQLKVEDACKAVINDPVRWKNNEFTFYTNSFDVLRMAEPRFTSFETKRIVDFLSGILTKKLSESLSKYDIKNPKISNFIFLALLGKFRNWKETCVVCSAGGGDVIFRPCGHSVCTKSCFGKLLASQQIMINLDDYNYDITFKCPKCDIGIQIDDIIEPNKVYFDDDLFDTWSMAHEVYAASVK